MANEVATPRILDEEPSTNFDAVGRDRVGDYQRDNDIRGTVYVDSTPTPEVPEEEG